MRAYQPIVQAIQLLPVSLLLALWLPGAAIAAESPTLQHNGVTFTLAWDGEFSADERSKMTTWLESVADTVTLLHGAPPRSEMRIVFKRYRSKSAVPFARVLRNGKQGIQFYVNPTFPLDDFISDWTAYHEFSHLFIPFPGRADIWFSEGLASYYQNVLLFRAGLLSEQEAWQKLYDGFERARADDRFPEMTLDELSRKMRETHAFMRIYWSGALYILQGDMQLRAATDSKLTLDKVLKEFGACCLNLERNWTGPEIAAEFDRIAGQPIFLPLYKTYETTTAIPPFMETLEAAGVTVVNGLVQIENDKDSSHQLN